MTLPDPKQKPRTPPKPTAASKDPKGTAAGRGFETRAGTAQVETGAKGQGFGLSSGGGGGDGGVRLDVETSAVPNTSSTCSTASARTGTSISRRQASWSMKYTIQRSGQITDIEVEASSGNPILDLASQRALMNTRTLAPLPAAFPGPAADRTSDFRVLTIREDTMKNTVRNFCVAAAGLGAIAMLGAQTPPAPQTSPARRRPKSEIKSRNSPETRARRRTTPCPISSR